MFRILAGEVAALLKRKLLSSRWAGLPLEISQLCRVSASFTVSCQTSYYNTRIALGRMSPDEETVGDLIAGCPRMRGRERHAPRFFLFATAGKGKARGPTMAVDETERPTLSSYMVVLVPQAKGGNPL